MRPVFAKGIGRQGTLTQAAAAGTLHLPAGNADQIFSLGQPLFCSEEDGTETEYLGLAAAVDALGVSGMFVLGAGKAAGAKVWTPEQVLIWPAERSAPLSREYQSGVEVQRAIGGAVYHTRLRDPFREETLAFDKVARSVYETWEAWFISAIGNGREAFTFVDEDRAVKTVKVMDGRVEQREAAPGVAKISIRLAIL
ncbi:MAG: hypothetical protein NTX50_06815 [Candidatus Sumerlaeota bacterium]|nr:hypothetical protein [Candidatus Sumerlaeota bacterium]